MQHGHSSDTPMQHTRNEEAKSDILIPRVRHRPACCGVHQIRVPGLDRASGGVDPAVEAALNAAIVHLYISRD